MSKRYPGNYITGNPVALSQTSNNGIFDLKDNYIATNNNTWQEVDGVYEIPKSLRFKNSSTAYFRKTGLSGNWKYVTLSFWFKGMPTNDTRIGNIFGGRNGSYGLQWAFNSNQQLIVVHDSWTGTAGFAATVTTNNRFRDPNAWYHFVISVDLTQPFGIAHKFYANGVAQPYSVGSTSGTFPNDLGGWSTVNFGSATANSSNTLYGNSLDGHVAEAHLVDGQILDPSYFGYFDPVTNIWQPKKYTGGWGPNGFYLPFTDNQSLPNLGKNFAGSNLLTYSNTFSNAIWNKQTCTITGSQSDPFNGSTASKLTSSTTGSNAPQIYYWTNANIQNNATYTFSCYAKAAEYGWVVLNHNDGLGSYRTWFNLSTGAVGTNASGNTSYSTYVGNGWYRCSVTRTMSSTNASNALYGIQISNADNADTFSSTSGSGIYIYGAQVNLGTITDNYIDTTSSFANNDYTQNNFSLTAGSSYDSMVDSPTNIITTATDIGGVVVGNYATFNALATNSDYNMNTSALTQGNLVTSSSTQNTVSYSSIGIPNQPYGKYYCEIVMTANSGGSCLIGLGTHQYKSLSGASYWPQCAYRAGGTLDYNGSTVQSGLTTWTTNDVIGVAVDMTINGGQVTFYKNNVSIVTKTGLIANWGVYDIFFSCQTNASSTGTFIANFGQRPFTYTPPAGHRGLCTTNIQQFLPLSPAAIQPFKYFDAIAHTGNATSNSSSNAINIVTNPGGFSPDLFWTKGRYGPVSSSNHLIEDSARGPRRPLVSHDTGAALTDRGIQAFLSNGVQFNNSDGGDGNYAGQQYINWMWKQSPNSGFNIITYTGNGTAGRTISHNLGVAPTMIIWKCTSGANNWVVWHKGMDQRYQATGWLYLNLAYARQTSATTNEYPTYKVDPTSTTITLNGAGSSNDVNNNGASYVAYVFADIPGFSKTGVWESNGNSPEGPFVYTGFRPKFVLYRSLYQGVEWIMKDTTREPLNTDDNAMNLGPNRGVLENNATYFGGPTGQNNIDWLSNGFKIRANNGNINYNYSGSNGDPYAFIAFAESPLYLNNRAR